MCRREAVYTGVVMTESAELLHTVAISENRRELHNRCSSIQMCQRSLLRPHGAEVIRNATVAHGGQLCPLMAVKMSRGHRFRHISDLVQSTRGQFGIWVKLFNNKGTRRRLLIGCGTQWRQSNTALLMRLMMLC